ncbi:hypothetical protein [Anaerovorax sp. IOR16]|uniref:hypothetical protein n=1 Tax=Anaerovorax sp. IOR16 TaxID=2773458 RepID=UPI0019D0C93C|nr:hypothetical protein [Anaerovorax sp. IOR16]
MDMIFFLLSFVFFICLIIGLVKPKLVIKWGMEENKSRKNVLKYYGIGTIIFFILFTVNIDAVDIEKDNSNISEPTIEQSMTVDEKAAANLDAKIVALGDIESITLDKLVDVQALRDSYEELTIDQKVLVTKLSLLTEVEKKIVILQNEENENQNTIKAQAALEAKAAREVQTVEVQPETETQTKEIVVDQSQNNEYTVYITRTGSKYHKDGCRYLRQSQIEISKSDAINQGYM